MGTRQELPTPVLALLAAVLAAGAPACRAPGRDLAAGAPAPGAAAGTDRFDGEPLGGLRTSAVTWKERLPQPYVHLEHVGDYREVRGRIRALLEAAARAGVEPAGAPFALYYDDPAAVPVAELRARVCLPVRGPGKGEDPRGELGRDVLPRALVAYARAAGPYEELPRLYPRLFAFVAGHGWTPAGPLREVYLVPPGAAPDAAELEAEVQLPWQPGS